MILLSCLNYFSCGITNKLNYETCVDHVHSLNTAMVTCIILSSYINLSCITIYSRHHPLPCRLITDVTDYVIILSTLIRNSILFEFLISTMHECQ